jgi:hypothetical protein
MFLPTRKGTALAASVLCLLGLGAVPAAAAPAARQVPKVPWSKVGPGWAITQYSTGTVFPNDPNKDKLGAELLYLTSPGGRKFTIYAWKKQPVLTENLIDWSGDGQRVLLNSQFDPLAPDNIEQIDLATGKVTAKFSWPGTVYPLGYTKPDGLNILAISRTGTKWQLQRYNLKGQLKKVLATGISAIYPDAIDAPDGLTVIASTSTGLEQVSNLGGVTARFSAPVKVASCFPQRWWDSETVLAGCYPKGVEPELSRLWLVNVKTGHWQPLSNPVKSTYQGNAWQLKSGLFLQEFTSCEFVAQQYRNGSVHPVTVPDSKNAVIVAGIGSRLLIAAQTSCDQSSGSLIWFNPATRAVSYVLRATGHAIGVEAAEAFGGRAVIG